MYVCMNVGMYACMHLEINLEKISYKFGKKSRKNLKLFFFLVKKNLEQQKCWSGDKGARKSSPGSHIALCCIMT